MIILNGIKSEKTSKLESLGCFCFVVRDDACKVDVKRDVEALFGVSVRRVNLCKFSTKAKKKYTKNGVMYTRCACLKKAFVYLRKDSDLINFNKLLE